MCYTQFLQFLGVYGCLEGTEIEVWYDQLGFSAHLISTISLY